MKSGWWAVAAGVFTFWHSLSAHRVDEYLQASIVTLGKSQVTIVMRLTPGVMVVDTILPLIDLNGDGQISEKEQGAYAELVLRDLALSIDGLDARPVLSTMSFPTIEELKEGLSEIVLIFRVPLPDNAGPRRMVLDNRHQGKMSAYLVNCLQPPAGISISKQERNRSQSLYQIEFSLPASTPDQAMRTWLVMVLALMFTGFVVFLKGALRRRSARVGSAVEPPTAK